MAGGFLMSPHLCAMTSAWSPLVRRTFAYIKGLLNYMLLQRLSAWWSSTASTVLGGLMAVAGLAATTPGAHALSTLGISEPLIDKIGAASIVLGAFLITPKKS